MRTASIVLLLLCIAELAAAFGVASGALTPSLSSSQRAPPVTLCQATWGTRPGPQYSAAARAAARAARQAESPTKAAPPPPTGYTTAQKQPHEAVQKAPASQRYHLESQAAVPTPEVPKTVQPKKTPGMKQTLAREATQAPPAAASTPEDVSTEAVAQVLMDFCQTDFAKKMCEYCSVSPTEFGQLSSMFESVRVEQRKIVVRLNRRFEQRSEKLLDRLVKYLRTEMPQLKQLQYEVRSPPTTRTFIIS